MSKETVTAEVTTDAVDSRARAKLENCILICLGLEIGELNVIRFQGVVVYYEVMLNG